jgi:hypothetical protein
VLADADAEAAEAADLDAEAEVAEEEADAALDADAQLGLVLSWICCRLQRFVAKLIVASSRVSKRKWGKTSCCLTVDIGLRASREHAASYAVNDRTVAADTGDVKGSASAQVVTKASLLRKSAIVLRCTHIYSQRIEVSGP